MLIYHWDITGGNLGVNVHLPLVCFKHESTLDLPGCNTIAQKAMGYYCIIPSVSIIGVNDGCSMPGDQTDNQHHPISKEDGLKCPTEHADVKHFGSI